MKLRNYYSFAIFLFAIFFSMQGTGQDDYYWVGGQGNWSEISHWATSSGGATIHNEIPDGADNVFFDENSFESDGDTIFLDAGNNVCRNMTWENLQFKPVFRGVDTLLFRIYGSLYMHENMVMDYWGQLSFEDTLGGQTVNTAGHRFYNDVIFNGEGGEWTLLDTLYVQDTNDFIYKKVFLNYGTLITNGEALIAEGFSSVKSSDRVLDIRDSEITILGSWQAIGEDLTLYSDNSTIFCVEFITSIDGEYLVFNDIVITGQFGGILNNNIRTAHNNVIFNQSGIVEGNCTIDSLIMNGNPMDSCLVNGTDTINYANIRSFGRISGEYHDIRKLVCDDFIKFTGNWNHVDSAFLNGKGLVTGMNDFDYLLFNTEGIMDGTNYCDKAVFSSDGELYGSNVFDYLVFASGYNYIFEHDSANTSTYKQKILSDFTVIGECEGGLTTLVSDVNTVQALLEYEPTGGFTKEYLVLRDMKIIGEGSFIVNNGIDLGNNTGWIINELTERDLYWVGGSGTWDDRDHWSLTSGGPGGECPPTLLDNAYFDQNSFTNANDAVYVNVKYASCHDMDWTGANLEPVLLSTDDSNPDTNNIRIYGSLTFSPAMNMQFPGEIFFESEETGETVTMAEQQFNNNTFFRGKGGGWTFMDAYATSDTIYFLHGNLNTNDQEVMANNFNSSDTTTRSLSLGKSVITVAQQNADAWWLNGQNLTFDGDESTIKATGALQGHVRSDNSGKLVYHNVEIYGYKAQLKNNAYCHYNLVDFYNAENESVGPCNIDTLTFYGPFGAVRDSDTIYAVECYGLYDTIAGGAHVITVAHFYEQGIVYGINKIDSLFFYKKGYIQLMNEVDTAVFYGNGEITGSNQFNKLTFSAGKKYTFEADSTQTIVDRWTANGNCQGSIIIQSDLPGRETYVRKVNGPVELDYVSVRDVHALGQTPFKATNAIDLGNNTNWEFTQPAPLGLYWVNGTGNWDDPNHWAAYSGGPGNYCVPKEIDNVYFDENSFDKVNDTVFVNVDNAVCKSMYWTGSEDWEPIFIGPDTNALTIYGSLIMNPDMTNGFAGPVYFEEIAGKSGGKADADTVWTFGKTFLNNTFFQGIGDKWQFLSDFNSEMNIYLVHGHLIFGENNIGCSRFLSDYENNRILDISNSTVSMNIINFDAWYVNAINLDLMADNSLLVASGFACHIKNENGDYLQFNDIRVDGLNAGIYNYSNTVEYNNIEFNNDLGHIRGNFIVDDIRFYGDNCSMYDYSETDVAIFYGTNGSIDGNHIINTSIFNAKGSIINSNYIHDATFMADGNILGINTFDILTFSPGGTYFLQANQVQTINEEFNVRGNNCLSIYIKSFTPGTKANIYMEEGIVAGDFLELRDIHAEGGADFYAGANSYLINTSGWIQENAPGYIYGFGNEAQTFCLGTEYDITTENFNGTPSTLYFWNGSAIPGDSLLTITEPGAYTLMIDYGQGCIWNDTVDIEADYPPVVNLDEGPYCEGDVLGLEVFPKEMHYEYNWFNGSQEQTQYAEMSHNGNIWVEVTDTLTGCMSSDEQVIEVIETPDPDSYLGEDTTLIWGETITLNAGPGDEFSWMVSDPLVQIENPEDQIIEATGTQEGVEYSVEVTQNGCKGSGLIYIGEFPRCAAALPTAFTPNGDGDNDVLYVRGNGLADLNFMLYDRYGKLVFQSHDLTEGWDGLNVGAKQEMEVYTYYLKAICEDGGLIEQTGSITLIR